MEYLSELIVELERKLEDQRVFYEEAATQERDALRARILELEREVSIMKLKLGQITHHR